jgi:chromosome segregation ATPase
VYKRKLAAFGITDIKQEEDRLKFLDAELAKLQEEQTSLEKIKRGQQKRLEELTVPDDGKAQIGQAERARVQEQKQLHEAISRKEKEVAKLHYSCITK